MANLLLQVQHEFCTAPIPKEKNEGEAFGLRFDENHCLLSRMGRRILCVDDDKDWRFVLENTLTDAGYEVLTVANATEAWERAELFEPELLILDLDLAGENGLML